MGVCVGLLEPFDCHVCVDLCRGKAGVAEQLLDTAQIGAAIEHVRRETVPQFVRTD